MASQTLFLQIDQQVYGIQEATAGMTTRQLISYVTSLTSKLSHFHLQTQILSEDSPASCPRVCLDYRPQLFLPNCPNFHRLVLNINQHTMNDLHRKFSQPEQGPPVFMHFPSPPDTLAHQHQHNHHNHTSQPLKHQTSYRELLPRPPLQRQAEDKSVNHVPATPLTFNLHSPYKPKLKKSCRPSSRIGSEAKGTEGYKREDSWVKKVEDFSRTSSKMATNWNTFGSLSMSSLTPRTEKNSQACNSGTPEAFPQAYSLAKYTGLSSHPASTQTETKENYPFLHDQGLQLSTLQQENQFQKKTIENLHSEILKVKREANTQEIEEVGKVRFAKGDDSMRIKGDSKRCDLLEDRGRLVDQVDQLKRELSDKHQLNIYLEQQCKHYISNYEESLLEAKTQKILVKDRESSLESQVNTLHSQVDHQKAELVSLRTNFQKSCQDQLSEEERLNRCIEAQLNKLTDQHNSMEVDKTEINMLLMKLEGLHTHNELLAQTSRDAREVSVRLEAHSEQLRGEFQLKRQELEQEASKWESDYCKLDKYRVQLEAGQRQLEEGRQRQKLEQVKNKHIWEQEKLQLESEIKEALNIIEEKQRLNKLESEEREKATAQLAQTVCLLREEVRIKGRRVGQLEETLEEKQSLVDDLQGSKMNLSNSVRELQEQLARADIKSLQALLRVSDEQLLFNEMQEKMVLEGKLAQRQLREQGEEIEQARERNQMHEVQLTQAREREQMHDVQLTQAREKEQMHEVQLTQARSELSCQGQQLAEARMFIHSAEAQKEGHLLDCNQRRLQMEEEIKQLHEHIAVLEQARMNDLEALSCREAESLLESAKQDLTSVETGDYLSVDREGISYMCQLLGCQLQEDNILNSIIQRLTQFVSSHQLRYRISDSYLNILELFDIQEGENSQVKLMQQIESHREGMGLLVERVQQLEDKSDGQKQEIKTMWEQQKLQSALLHQAKVEKGLLWIEKGQLCRLNHHLNEEIVSLGSQICNSRLQTREMLTLCGVTNRESQESEYFLTANSLPSQKG